MPAILIEQQLTVENTLQYWKIEFYIIQSHSRQEEVRLAFRVADELEVAALRAEWLLIFLFCNPQKATEAGKHRACICLQCEILHYTCG